MEEEEEETLEAFEINYDVFSDSWVMEFDGCWNTITLDPSPYFVPSPSSSSIRPPSELMMEHSMSRRYRRGKGLGRERRIRRGSWTWRGRSLTRCWRCCGGKDDADSSRHCNPTACSRRALGRSTVQLLSPFSNQCELDDGVCYYSNMPAEERERMLKDVILYCNQQWRFR